MNCPPDTHHSVLENSLIGTGTHHGRHLLRSAGLSSPHRRRPGKPTSLFHFTCASSSSMSSSSSFLFSTRYVGPPPRPQPHSRDVRQRPQGPPARRPRRPPRGHHPRRRRLLRRLVPALPRHRPRLLAPGRPARPPRPPRLRQGQRRPRQRRRRPVQRLGHADLCLVRGRQARARGRRREGARRQHQGVDGGRGGAGEQGEAGCWGRRSEGVRLINGVDAGGAHGARIQNSGGASQTEPVPEYSYGHLTDLRLQAGNNKLEKRQQISHGFSLYCFLLVTIPSFIP